jgi:hypothetical protein
MGNYMLRGTKRSKNEVVVPEEEESEGDIDNNIGGAL